MALATACVVACSGGSEGVSGGAEVVSVLDGGDVRGDDLPAVPDAGPRVAPDQDAVVSDASEGEEDTGGPVYHPFCIKVCDAIATCDALPKSVCLERCSGGDACDVTCLEHSQTCAEAAECLGVWEPAQTFDPGPYGAVFRTTAGDVVVPTDAGEWSLSSHWNGRDMAVFFFTTNGFAYASALWQTGLQEWLEGSPRNVHYFFVSFTDSTGSDAGQKEVEAMRSRMDAVVGQLDPVRQCHWARRIHYATQPLQKIGGPLLAALAESGGQAVLGIDRTQKWRQIGLLQLVTGGSPEIRLVNYDVRYWNFEWVREQALAASSAKVIPVHLAKDGAGFDTVIELPSAAEMAAYDTLEIDLGGWCKDHKDENCAEWDYKSRALLCEREEGDNPDAATPCQAAVPEVVAVPETLGSCAGTANTCTTDSDCEDSVACEGYVAPVAGTPGVVADTKACSCVGLDGATHLNQRTCNSGGTGFGACPCPCPTELQRWITPYHREGRWVSDATPALAILGRGGKQRIAFDAANFPMVDFSLRLSNRGVGLRPVAMAPLFKGGGFNPSYNAKYSPVTVKVPATTKKVELYAIISGHGWGAELANCAEFCNHEHHFTIGGETFVQSFPMAGSLMGCAEQVDTNGAIPNQYGTWNLGRGGWCAGMDVKPMRVDVTAAVTPGGEVEVDYRGLYQGKDYVPQPNPQPTGGFGAEIDMSSWLVFYE